MLDHCREEHPRNIFFKNKQKLTVSNFTEPMKSVEDLSKTEEAVETEEKTHIHSAPGTPTPSLQNKIDDLPKLAQKPTIIESRNQRTASISSPISTATGTIKRDQKESTVHQKLKRIKKKNQGLKQGNKARSESVTRHKI
ncbi:hypothetical protein JTB14_030969 [Gonioctena quinquepunctata]|nr:hypothetical protein JTB14_030969 [Gonioctena quinquepunctata]